MTDIQYANRHGYSDVHPYEVVRKVSDKCLEVRSMKSTLDPEWKPEIVPGGFGGHCVNNYDQKWHTISDTSGRVVRIRKHKNGNWKDASGNVFKLNHEPIKFSDYNF
jgi:hypothetical protein